MSSGKLLGRRGAISHKPIASLYDRILADSPSVYWPMQETSGNIVDVIAGKNGTPSGGITYAEAAPWGNSIRFNTNEYFEIANDPLFDLADTFTISAWFKLAEVGTQRALFSRTGSSPTTSGWVLRHESDNKMAMFKSQVGAPMGFSTTLINDTTTWHHLVGVKPAGTAAPQLYIDGVAETMTGTATGQYLTATGTRVVLIGADRDWTLATTDKFNGWLAHIALFPRVLTAGEILAQYNAGI